MFERVSLCEKANSLYINFSKIWFNELINKKNKPNGYSTNRIYLGSIRDSYNSVIIYIITCT